MVGIQGFQNVFSSKSYDNTSYFTYGDLRLRKANWALLRNYDLKEQRGIHNYMTFSARVYNLALPLKQTNWLQNISMQPSNAVPQDVHVLISSWLVSKLFSFVGKRVAPANQPNNLWVKLLSTLSARVQFYPCWQMFRKICSQASLSSSSWTSHPWAHFPLQ